MDWRRLVSAIRQALTTSGAAATAREQRAVVDALRSRQIRPRRIAVLGSGGGVGTTTVAVLLASVLSAVREDQTLLVTVVSDNSDAAVRLAVPHAPDVTEILAGLRRRGQIPPTPVTSTGLRVLSAPGPESAPDDAQVAALLDAAASGHASTVVDLGTASRIGELGAMAGLFDTVLLVGGTTPDALSSASAVLVRLHSGLPTGSATRVLVVRSQSRGPSSAGGDRTEATVGAGVTIRALAYDAELASGRPLELARLSEATLTTAFTLAADIMRRR